MKDLRDFLLDRIAEDMDVAYMAAMHPPNVRSEFARRNAMRTAPLWTVSDASAFGQQLGARGSVEARPGRVLAEAEAKRRIVVNAMEPCQWVLRHLALAYADHEDYREEWKP
jgi:hypothetical protein